MRRLLLCLFLLFPTVASAAVVGTPNQIAVTCGASSGPLLPANAASKYIFVLAPTSGGVWINWTGGAATTAPPSEHLVAGAAKVWSPSVPQSAATCISDDGSNVTVTVEYN